MLFCGKSCLKRRETLILAQNAVSFAESARVSGLFSDFGGNLGLNTVASETNAENFAELGRLLV